MKMIKKIILLIAAVLLLTGCSNKDKEVPVSNDTSAADVTGTDLGKEEAETEGTASENTVSEGAADDQVIDYPFVYNNVTIHMNSEAAQVVEALGESQDYFEAPSCAFQGLDKIYYYSGIELNTYPLDGVDYISSINLIDDSVSTVKGIYLGSSLEEVTTAYGDDFTEDMGLYTYTLGETELTFLIEGNVVTAITYMAILEE